MQRYLKRTQTKVPSEDRAWTIIGHLEGEARNYIINKAESERDTPEKKFEQLSSRFGAGGNRIEPRPAGKRVMSAVLRRARGSQESGISAGVYHYQAL